MPDSRFFLMVVALLLLAGCASQSTLQPGPLSRYAKIPSTAVKIAPDSDLHPPILHSDGWETPVPVSAPLNSAGAEDSPFILPDGSSFYFFFTPDAGIPAEKQLFDGVTGIYFSKKAGTGWSEPERVLLQKSGQLALDGCEFVQGNMMLFCSAREGYTGINWFTAEYDDGRWKDWNRVDFKEDYKVGELHITSDGSELYYHSDRPGGKGGLDIWLSEKSGSVWQDPENIEIINTDANEGWPFISEDGKELWFTRTYLGTPAIFRSNKTAEGWSEPEMIISQFAGEPTLDNKGNLYFTHHFYRDGKMIEADIYVARKR